MRHLDSEREVVHNWLGVCDHRLLDKCWTGRLVVMRGCCIGAFSKPDGNDGFLIF